MQKQFELLKSSRPKDSLLRAVGFVIVTTAVALSAQIFTNQYLPGPYFFYFFPATMVTTWYYGLRAGVATSLLCILGANYLMFEPRFSFSINNLSEAFTLGFVFLATSFGGWLVSLIDSRQRLAQLAKIELETTLSSIGDAVVVINAEKQIAFLNPVAEALTGWTLSDARQKPMDLVFNIINEKTRLPAENPVDRVLREGVVVGLANHTVLVAKDGTERPIEDSAAPIVMPGQKGATGVVLVFRDVSERYQTEARARQSEDRLKLALSSGRLGTFYIDLKTYEVTVSNELLKILKHDDLKGDVSKIVEQMVHPDDRERHQREMQKTISERVPFELEYRFLLPDGQIKWILSRANLVTGSNDEPVGISGVTVDIDDLKKAQEKLQASERRFAMLFESSPLATAITRVPSGEILDINPAFQKLLGYEKNEILGQTSVEFGLHTSNKKRDEVYKRIAQEGFVDGVELELRSRDGRVIPTAVSIRVAKLDNHPFAITSVVDLTKIREAEKRLWQAEQFELKESERKFRQLANSIPQMSWTTNESGKIDYVNGRWTEFTGLDLQSTIADGGISLVHPDDIERVRATWNDALESGKPFDVEFRLLNPLTNHYHWFLSRGVPITDQNNRITKWFGTNTDIEPIKSAQQELKEAKEEAERANELKSAFLANMSHEIRTPLGAMIGFADLLKDPNLSLSERENYIDILSRNGESLSVIINDILDLSKVEAGQLSLEYTDVSVRSVVEDVVSLLRVKAREKNIAFELKIHENVPNYIVSDSLRIRQVLLNIVGNAIKFTNYGSVAVEVFPNSVAEKASGVCFKVSDTGIGIPTSQKEKIFEMLDPVIGRLASPLVVACAKDFRRGLVGVSPALK